MEAALLNFTDSDNLSTLLSTPSSPLEEVLDEELVVQELKQINNDLVNFLLQDHNFDKLVSYVCGVPAENVNKNYTLYNQNKNTKFPFIACELLSANNEHINKHFLGLNSQNEPASPASAEEQSETKVSANFIKFMDVLNSPTPIDFTVVGYFAKILKVLFQAEGKHVSYVLFQHNPQYLKQLVEHVYSDSIQEILLMVIKLDAPYFRSVGGDHYLNQRIELVEAVFNNLFPDTKKDEPYDISSQRQINCSAILNLLLTSYSCFSNGKNIINCFLTLEKISKVLKGLLNQTIVQAVVPLIQELCSHFRDAYSSKDKLPLLDLIRFTECIVKPNIPDTEPLIVSVVDTLEDIVESLRLEKCSGSLQPKQGQENITYSDFNNNQRKVGIVETIYNFLKLQNAKVDQKIIDTKAISVLLEMFVKNPWNSILHNNINKALTFIIEHGSSLLKENLFEGAKILDFISAEAKEPEVQVHLKTGNKTKKSYIAHLNVIANLIEKCDDPFVKNICNNHEEWQEFKNNSLKKENEKNKGLVDYPPPKPYEGKETVTFGGSFGSSPITKIDGAFNKVYVMSPTQEDNKKETAKKKVEYDEPDATPKSSKRLGWGDF